MSCPRKVIGTGPIKSGRSPSADFAPEAVTEYETRLYKQGRGWQERPSAKLALEQRTSTVGHVLIPPRWRLASETSAVSGASCASTTWRSETGLLRYSWVIFALLRPPTANAGFRTEATRFASVLT
jgi:hypothetical protein